MNNWPMLVGILAIVIWAGYIGLYVSRWNDD